MTIGDRFFVDGGLRRTLHASVALDQGVNLLLGINPLVPFDSSDRPSDSQLPAHQLIKGGLPLILSQTFRALIQSRMKIGFQKYRSTHPATDLVLLEPDRGDEEIFFTNIFSYSSRNALCEHAYQATRRDLLHRAEQLEPVLEQHGIGLRMDRLEDQDRSLTRSLNPAGAGYSTVSRSLSETLDDLEDMLERQAV